MGRGGCGRIDHLGFSFYPRLHQRALIGRTAHETTVIAYALLRIANGKPQRPVGCAMCNVKNTATGHCIRCCVCQLEIVGDPFKGGHRQQQDNLTARLSRGGEVSLWNACARVVPILRLLLVLYIGHVGGDRRQAGDHEDRQLAEYGERGRRAVINDLLAVRRRKQNSHGPAPPILGEIGASANYAFSSQHRRVRP